MRVLLGIPGSTWQANFGMSLMQLVCASTQIKGSPEIAIQSARGSILSRSRERIAQVAVDGGADYLLFLDTDMIFPSWTLEALLDAGKDIVACNCPTKKLPSTTTARMPPTPDFPAGEPVYQQDRAPGEVLKQVWRVGTGVMLIRTDVFRRIPKPWFPITWDLETADYVGEDWGFCTKAEEADIPVYVEMHLSDHIKHIGTVDYTHGMVEVLKKAPKQGRILV